MDEKCVAPLVAEIRQYANEMLAQRSIEPLPFQGYVDYIQHGNRLSFESHYFQRRKQLSVVGLAVFLDKEPAMIDYLEEIIWAVLQEYSWALPAHLKQEGAFFSSDSPTCIDLFSAETGQTLAEMLALFGDLFSDSLQQAIQQEIQRRLFVPFLAQPWEWETKENNWSAVIAGSLGMAALDALPKDSKQRCEILKRLTISFDSFLRGYASDGACEEGVGYWAYGFGYYCYFAAHYARVEKDYRYLEGDLIRAIAEFPFYAWLGEDHFVPFSDASRVTLPTGLLCFCRDQFDVSISTISRVSPLDFDHCYRWAHLIKNLQWTHYESIKKQENHQPSQHYFANSEWLVARNPAEDFVFAAKGGRNDVSHNHNDSGHFIIGDKHELFLTDLGAGEYTRNYFDDNVRYTILNNRSFGHSVPFINDCEQQYGSAGAMDVFYQFSHNETIFSMELSSVYPEASCLTSFKRTFLYPSEAKSIVLTDEFSFKQANIPIEEAFVSTIKPEIRGQRIYWIGKEHSLLLQPDEFTTNIEMQSMLYQADNGEERTMYRVFFPITAEKQHRCHYKFTLIKRGEENEI